MTKIKSKLDIIELRNTQKQYLVSKFRFTFNTELSDKISK